MKKETLERGNELLKLIANLEEHIKSVFSHYDKYNSYQGVPFKPTDRNSPSFIASPWFTSEQRVLINEYVPFPIDKFMAIYRANVEEEITRLKKEFTDLKDQEDEL